MLTALIGETGAGKTTLMVRTHADPSSSVLRMLTDGVNVQWRAYDHSFLQDVLAGRKTTGVIEGDIRVQVSSALDNMQLTSALVVPRAAG